MADLALLRPFFSFLCSFQQKFCQIIGLCHLPGVCAPCGKSWIRRCNKTKKSLHNVSCQLLDSCVCIVLCRFHVNTLAAPAESWRLFACVTQRQTDRRTELNTKPITHIASMCQERAAYHRACQIPTSAHIPQVTSRTPKEPVPIPDVTS